MIEFDVVSLDLRLVDVCFYFSRSFVLGRVPANHVNVVSVDKCAEGAPIQVHRGDFGPFIRVVIEHFTFIQKGPDIKTFLLIVFAINSSPKGKNPVLNKNNRERVSEVDHIRQGSQFTRPEVVFEAFGCNLGQIIRNSATYNQSFGVFDGAGRVVGKRELFHWLEYLYQSV